MPPLFFGRDWTFPKDFDRGIRKEASIAAKRTGEDLLMGECFEVKTEATLPDRECFSFLNFAYKHPRSRLFLLSQLLLFKQITFGIIIINHPIPSMPFLRWAVLSNYHIWSRDPRPIQIRRAGRRYFELLDGRGWVFDWPYWHAFLMLSFLLQVDFGKWYNGSGSAYWRNMATEKRKSHGFPLFLICLSTQKWLFSTGPFSRTEIEGERVDLIEPAGQTAWWNPSW